MKYLVKLFLAQEAEKNECFLLLRDLAIENCHMHLGYIFPTQIKKFKKFFFQTWPEICFYWDFKSRQAPIHVHIWIIIAKFLRLPYSLFLLYYYFIIPYYYNCSNDKFASLFPVLKSLNHLLKHMCNFLIVKVPESLKIWIYPVFLALVSSDIDTFSDNWN